MQGGQADETLFFFPPVDVRAFVCLPQECLSGPDQRNTAERPIPFTVPQGQGQAV